MDKDLASTLPLLGGSDARRSVQRFIDLLTSILSILAVWIGQQLPTYFLRHFIDLGEKSSRLGLDTTFESHGHCGQRHLRGWARRCRICSRSFARSSLSTRADNWSVAYFRS